VVRGNGHLLRCRIVAPTAHRAPELFEALAECAAGVGQALGSEDQEGDHQDDDQVAGLEDAGDKTRSLCRGWSAVARGSDGRPLPGGQLVGFACAALAAVAGLARGPVRGAGEIHDGSEELRGLAGEEPVSRETLDGGNGAPVVIERRPDD
jgi:hypothetical protein